MIGHGVSSRSSHSWAAGRTTPSAKSWTHFWIWSWSSLRSSEKSAIGDLLRGRKLPVSNLASPPARMCLRTRRCPPGGGPAGTEACGDGCSIRRGAGAGVLTDLVVHRLVDPGRELARDRVGTLLGDRAGGDELAQLGVRRGGERVDHGLGVLAQRRCVLADGLAALQRRAQ